MYMYITYVHVNEVESNVTSSTFLASTVYHVLAIACLGGMLLVYSARGGGRNKPQHTD